MDSSNIRPGARSRPDGSADAGPPLTRRRVAGPQEASPQGPGETGPQAVGFEQAPVTITRGPLQPLVPTAGGNAVTLRLQAARVKSPAQYLEDVAQGMRAVEQAYADDPYDFNNVRDAARALSHKGEFVKAEQVLRWHLELNPADGDACAELAEVHLQAGNVDAARRADMASKKRGHDGLSSFHFALHSGGNLSGFVDNPEPGAAPMQRAMETLLAVNNGLPGRTREEFGAFYDQIPTWCEKARVWALAQHVPNALQCLQMAIRSGELPLNLTHSRVMSNLIGHPNMVTLLRRVGEAPEQLASIAFNIRTPERVLQARRRQAGCTARLTTMAQVAQDAFHANPHDLRAVADASKMLMILGRLHEAQELLKWHIALHPEGGGGHVELARLLVRMDKLDEARALGTEASANGYVGPFFNQIAPFLGGFAQVGEVMQDADVLFARALSWHSRPEPRFGAAVDDNDDSDAEVEEPDTRARDEAFERLSDRDRALYSVIWDPEPSRVVRYLESATRGGPLPLGMTHLGLMHAVSRDLNSMALLAGIGETPEQLAAIAFNIQVPPDAVGTPQAQAWHSAKIQDKAEMLLRAYRRNPNYHMTREVVWMQADAGRSAVAEQLMRGWRGPPPAGVAHHEDLARLQLRMNQFDAALESAQHARTLGGGNDVLVEVYLLDDGYAEARQLLEGSGKWMELAMAEFSLGNREASDAAIGRITSARDKGLAFAWRGADFAAKAIECWEEAMHTGQLPLNLTYSPWLRELAATRDDVRGFLERIGEAPEQLAKISLPVREV